MHGEQIEGRILDIVYPAKDIKFYKKTMHCCKQMAFHIYEQERIIVYIPEFREYSIRASKDIIQQIKFCPWCSQKLETSLRDEFFDILENEYKLDTLYLNKENMPKEFQSEEWWKKRGL